jgi:polar amino acid transport system substrate-binding protein
MEISNSRLKHKYVIQMYGTLFVLALLSPLTVGQTLTFYAEHYPPYTIDVKTDTNTMNLFTTNIDGKRMHAGLDIELIRHAYAVMGVDAIFKFSPWKRVMRNVELGNVLGGISCRRTKAREVFASFSTPVSQSRLAFITRSDFQGEVPQNLARLKSLNVVIVSGYSQQSMLESRGIKYTAASSLTQGLNLVQHRDQDVFFSGWEGAAYEAKRLGYLDKLIFTRPTTVTVKDFHVCFSKKYAESDKWRLLLNKGLEKIRIQGQMTSIKQKYGIENSY